MQSLLILLAPAFFAASIYMILGRLIVLVDGEAHSPIRVKWLTKIFVGGDVLSFLAQSAGTSLSIFTTSKHQSNTSRWWDARQSQETIRRRPRRAHHHSRSRDPSPLLRTLCNHLGNLPLAHQSYAQPTLQTTLHPMGKLPVHPVHRQRSHSRPVRVPYHRVCHGIGWCLVEA